MNPKPLAPLKNLTLPLAMRNLSLERPIRPKNTTVGNRLLPRSAPYPLQISPDLAGYCRMKITSRLAAFLIILAPYLGLAQNHEVETNNIYMAQAPAWLTRNRVDRGVAHIQTLLEWDI